MNNPLVVTSSSADYEVLLVEEFLRTLRGRTRFICQVIINLLVRSWHSFHFVPLAPTYNFMPNVFPWGINPDGDLLDTRTNEVVVTGHNAGAVHVPRFGEDGRLISKKVQNA